jgi:predicted DNA-binding transcriptional regulator YafY
VRWGVEKRLEFIEFRLFWEGGINRADIMDQFGVSVPQASKDLSLYEEKAPGNLVYDKSGKRYLAAPEFKPVLLEPEADRYLAQLRSVSDNFVAVQETWLSALPVHDAMPVPHRRVDVHVLRSVVAAVRDKRAIEIQYQSMNIARPEPMWRWISPHAFAFDGLRWHVRAYCHVDHKFKDFILSRFLNTRATADAAASLSEDRLWTEFFDVVLRPNPKLSDEQQRVIAQDYNMTPEDHVAVPVRKALLYYFRKRLRLDVAEALDDPHECPVVVVNSKAFAKALAEATA